MNAKYLIAASLAAAIILFLSGAIVHAVPPIGDPPVREFTDSSAVPAFVRQHTSGNGMYFAPGGVFAAVFLRPDGQTPFDFQGLLIGDFLVGLVASFFLSLMVLFTRVRSALGGAAFFAVAALAAGFANIVPEWNWYGFSITHTVFQFVDLLIGWTLAGLAVGALRRKLAPPKP